MTEAEALLATIGDTVTYKGHDTWITYISRHRTKGVMFQLENAIAPVSFRDVEKCVRGIKNIYVN